MIKLLFIYVLTTSYSFADTDVFFEPVNVTKEQIKAKEAIILEVKSLKPYLDLKDCNNKKDNDECLKTFITPEFIKSVATSGETKICSEADECLNYKNAEIMTAVKNYIKLFLDSIELNKHQNVSVRSKTDSQITKDIKAFPQGTKVWIVPSKPDRHVEMFEPSYIIEIKSGILRFTYFSDGNGC